MDTKDNRGWPKDVPDLGPLPTLADLAGEVKGLKAEIRKLRGELRAHSHPYVTPYSERIM